MIFFYVLQWFLYVEIKNKKIILIYFQIKKFVKSITQLSIIHTNTNTAPLEVYLLGGLSPPRSRLEMGLVSGRIDRLHVKAMSKGFLRQENHFTVEFKRDNFLTGNYTLEIQREVVHLHSLFLLTEWLVNPTLEHANQRATIDSLHCLIRRVCEKSFLMISNCTLEIQREVVHLHNLLLLTEWLVNLTLEHENQRATIDSLRCLILWWNLTAWHAFGRRLLASQSQLQVLKAQWRRLCEANSSFLQQFLQDVIQCCQDECRWLNWSIISAQWCSN